MMRALLTVFALLATMSTALAQSKCDPAQLAERIDRYAAQPFSALSWRVLNGLGDPGIEPSPGYEQWENQEEYRKLAQQVLKLPEAPQIGFACRTGYPLSVLRRHVAQFGAGDPYTVQWTKVQQQVFAACSQDGAQATWLPDPLVGIDQAREAAQRDDRVYQQATVAFYAEPAKAVDLFKAIGAGGSPHRAAARYNVANLLANARQLADARKEADSILADPALKPVHTITRELLGYIANLEDTAAGWTALIDEASATIMWPSADILSSPDHRNEFARALNDIDYAGVRGKDTDWWLKGELPENPTISKALVDATRKSPMALWMIGGQSLHQKQQRLGWALRGEKWGGHATSFAGRVLALAPTGPSLPPLPRDMLETLAAPADAASAETLWRKVWEISVKTETSCGAAPETAAFPVYFEQAVRASAAARDFARIYAAVGQAGYAKSGFVNAQIPRRLMSFLLAAGNIAEARNLRSVLLTEARLSALPEADRSTMRAAASRFKAWIAENEEEWRQAVLELDVRTSSPLLNLLSNENLVSMASDERFSASERALFSRVAWTRRYARSRVTSEDALKQLLAHDPELNQSYQALLAEFPNLSSERRQLLFVLRNPRLGILVNAPNSWEQAGLQLAAGDSYSDISSGDHNDRNWWCPLETDRHLGAIRQAFDQDADIEEPADYLKAELSAVYDAEQRAEALAKREAVLRSHEIVKQAQWKSLARLAQAPSAPKKLTEAAIAWGKSSRGKDGAPEALARAVATTRSGCNWHGRHGSYSKAAQQLLVTRFADSPFAAQTPYWFDCMRSEWDAQGNRAQLCETRSWPKQAVPR